MRNIAPIRTVAPWIGGKRNLARRLVPIIDAVPHGAYVEPFVGMGGVFFRRTRVPACEVINDLSGDVATLFRILQNHYEAFCDMLRWQLTSREEFERLKGMDGERLTDLQRAARFLYVQRTGFGGKVAGRTFGITKGPARFDVTRLADALADVHERLAGVWIERLPWAEAVARWDDPGALFYLDPPYHGTEHYYGRGMFERAEFEAMAEVLKALRGRFVLTVNDCEETRRTFERFEVEATTVTYTAAGHMGHKQAGELIVTGPGRWRGG